MMITKEMLEQPRTPAELRAFVAAKRAEIEADRGEYEAAMQKRGLYKRFVEELMPLSRLSESLFGPDVLVRPMLGNQGFDAEILNRNGEVIERVELTIPHDGAAAADNVRKVIKRGFGEVYTRTYGSSVLATVFDHVIEVAKQKSTKDYGDCTLIIVASSGFPAYEAELAATNDEAQQLEKALRALPWRARRVIVDIPDIRRYFVVL